MSNIPAGAWKHHAGYTWPNDTEEGKRWHIIARRSLLLNVLVWRATKAATIIQAMSLESLLLLFIGRHERGEL